MVLQEADFDGGLSQDTIQCILSKINQYSRLDCNIYLSRCFAVSTVVEWDNISNMMDSIHFVSEETPSCP